MKISIGPYAELQVMCLIVAQQTNLSNLHRSLDRGLKHTFSSFLSSSWD